MYKLDLQELETTPPTIGITLETPFANVTFVKLMLFEVTFLMLVVPF